MYAEFEVLRRVPALPVYELEGRAPVIRVYGGATDAFDR